ncbi:MAG TPA: tetratricopeptide repeat protein [Kofleriaceae bacterium]
MRTTGLAVLLLATSARASEPMEPDDLPAPRPEIARGEPKVAMPAVPGFEPPVIEPGFHRPRELRLRGAPLRGQEMRVKGYVTSIYDCVAELALSNPDLRRAALVEAIDRDPRHCDQPRFYLGEDKGAPVEASITVVDVPRRPSKPERDALSLAELGKWPKVPTLAVHDPVIVTGTWALRSPRGEYDSNGLLVYKALDHVAPGTASAVLPAAAPVTDPEPEVDVAVVTKAPLRRLVANPVFNTSVDHLNACNQRILAGRYDEAIAECEAAAAAWPGNHLAWYEAASAYIARRQWREARDAAARAVAMRPDVAMYQLYYGMALYEAEQQRVREEQAAREHRQPDEVAIDPSALELTAARDALFRATRLGPELWRAHHYLGRVYRDLDDARHAAEQFSQAIATHPSYLPPYVALTELYRRWGYADQALAVAMLGVGHVPPADAPALWYEAGMALHAKRAGDKAIEAFDKAVAGDHPDMFTRFLRGQVYLRKGRLADARQELEQVVRSTDPQVAEVRQLAVELLRQVAHKQRLKAGAGGGDCKRYGGCVEDTEGVIDRK